MTDISTNGFTALSDLLALMTRPAAYKRMLAELKRQTDRAESASAKLATASQAHERKVAEESVAIVAREKAVREREVAVSIDERNLIEREKAVAAARPPRFSDDPNLGPGGRSSSGLTREPIHG